MGRATSLQMMKDRVIWMLKYDNFELVDLPNNYFVFRTTNRELNKRLLYDGPWIIQGHYLAVQRWSPNFNPDYNKVKKLAIWVRVPTLPIHCYSEECLLELGNMIGRALKVDLNTLAHYQSSSNMVERGKFARVSVEIDLNKKLQSKFVIRRTVYTVEYEGLDIICFKCGKYGHTQEDCPLNAELEKTQASPDMNSLEKERPETAAEDQPRHPLVGVLGVSITKEFGTWMKAKKTFRQ
ncbi:uncharacterized protein LOC114732736 [Neltuma alba]|uniref:uncharacterized protein LOC114732736 n=1 Tax=Neltuma alba TaxID=207710 RepID=UPI0010A4E21F|nr:uncharacterized protein LOC114732736 [Prosopis alba]